MQSNSFSVSGLRKYTYTKMNFFIPFPSISTYPIITITIITKKNMHAYTQKKRILFACVVHNPSLPNYLKK